MGTMNNSGFIFVDVTFSSDTAILAAGDVIADTQLVGSISWSPGEAMKLESMVILDEDNNTAAAMDIYFLDSSVSLGTENNAISITDANARSILGYVPVASTDFKALINSKLACIRNIGLVLKPAATSTGVYIAAVTAGTPTQTASGLKARLAFSS